MSTGCEFHADALADLAGGRLEAFRVARVREHLAACPSCREELRLLERLSEAGPVPPAGLEARIAAAVRDAGQTSGTAGGRKAASRGSMRWAAWSLPLVAAAAVVLVWAGPPDMGGAAGGAVEVEQAVASDLREPYGAWPANGIEVAGEPVLSELTEADLERLLREMEP